MFIRWDIIKDNYELHLDEVRDFDQMVVFYHVPLLNIENKWD